METNLPAKTNAQGPILGVLAFIAGVLTAVSVTMIGFTSFTAFDPPGWLRMVSMAPLPGVALVSLIFGWVGLKNGSGRSWAIAGLVITGLALIAFVIMLNVGG